MTVFAGSKLARQLRARYDETEVYILLRTPSSTDIHRSKVQFSAQLLSLSWIYISHRSGGIELQPYV